LYGPEPCWEKRWAKMLSRWKKREDMDWEDIPRPRATARSSESKRKMREDWLIFSDSSPITVAGVAEADRVAGHCSDVESESPNAKPLILRSTQAISSPTKTEPLRCYLRTQRPSMLTRI